MHQCKMWLLQFEQLWYTTLKQGMIFKVRGNLKSCSLIIIFIDFLYSLVSYLIVDLKTQLNSSLKLITTRQVKLF
jgi:hypothetical protein